MYSYEENLYSKYLKKEWSTKFQCAGVYAITIDNKIVYIGKSDNVLRRIAEHYASIVFPQGKARKYAVMSEAKKAGCQIRFELLYKAKHQLGNEMYDEIGEKEGWYIRQYLPMLNTQIPREDDWHRFTVNKSAEAVTLQDILEEVKEPC